MNASTPRYLLDPFRIVSERRTPGCSVDHFGAAASPPYGRSVLPVAVRHVGDRVQHQAKSPVECYFAQSRGEFPPPNEKPKLDMLRSLYTILDENQG